MAPQPLSKVRPGVEVGTWFCGARLSAAPEDLCKLAFRIIANWSCVESSVLQLVAARLQADYEVVAAMLLAPRSSEAQTAAALAGIKHGMSHEELAFFDAFWSLANPCRKVRHRMGHHLWGYTTELPQHLLLLDPHYNVTHGAQLLSHYDREERYMSGRTTEEPGDEPEIDLSSILVYSRADLLRELEDSEEVLKIGQWLTPCLLPNYAEAPQERARLLASYPRLQRAFGRYQEQAEP